MPINLPPVTQQLIKGLEQGRAEQLTTLSKLVNLLVGEKALASVEKVAAVSPQQRGELQKLTQEALQLLNRASPSPAVKAQINQLTEQLQLLSSPQLKWAHLLINNRPLLTYTDKPLVQGQPLPVQLLNNLRLVHQDIPAALMTEPSTKLPPSPLLQAARAPSPATYAVTTKDQLTSFIETPRGPALPRLQEQGITTTPEVRQQTQNLLAAALRHLLPQKDKPHELFNALPLIQQLPTSIRRELLSTSLQQALKTVADQLRSPLQLSNPKLLPTLLKNNGVFFENKLVKGLQSSSSTGDKAEPSTTAKLTPARLSNQLTSQDLKGALLQLLNRIQQESATLPRVQESPRSGTTGTAPPATTTLPFPGAVNHSNLQTLPSLLKLLQFPRQSSGPQVNDKPPRDQLLALLQQHTLGALAKIQLQQVHAINHQQGQSETAQPSQSWLLEIPIKQGQEVNTLELRLEQGWLDKEREDQNETAERIRQWSVTLSFDLPTAGKFYAQLSVVKESVSAKLWAEEDATLDEAKNKLALLREQLEAQGLTIKHLQCVRGSPPSTTISLNYSLVDVTT